MTLNKEFRVLVLVLLLVIGSALFSIDRLSLDKGITEQVTRSEITGFASYNYGDCDDDNHAFCTLYGVPCRISYNGDKHCALDANDCVDGDYSYEHNATNFETNIADADTTGYLCRYGHWGEDPFDSATPEETFIEYQFTTSGEKGVGSIIVPRGAEVYHASMSIAGPTESPVPLAPGIDIGYDDEYEYSSFYDLIVENGDEKLDGYDFVFVGDYDSEEYGYNLWFTPITSFAMKGIILNAKRIGTFSPATGTLEVCKVSSKWTDSCYTNSNTSFTLNYSNIGTSENYYYVPFDGGGSYTFSQGDTFYLKFKFPDWADGSGNDYILIDAGSPVNQHGSLYTSSSGLADYKTYIPEIRFIHDIDGVTGTKGVYLTKEKSPESFTFTETLDELVDACNCTACTLTGGGEYCSVPIKVINHNTGNITLYNLNIGYTVLGIALDDANVTIDTPVTLTTNRANTYVNITGPNNFSYADKFSGSLTFVPRNVGTYNIDGYITLDGTSGGEIIDEYSTNINVTYEPNIDLEISPRYGVKNSWVTLSVDTDVKYPANITGEVDGDVINIEEITGSCTNKTDSMTGEEYEECILSETGSGFVTSDTASVKSYLAEVTLLDSKYGVTAYENKTFYIYDEKNITFRVEDGNDSDVTREIGFGIDTEDSSETGLLENITGTKVINIADVAGVDYSVELIRTGNPEMKVVFNEVTIADNMEIVTEYLTDKQEGESLLLHNILTFNPDFTYSNFNLYVDYDNVSSSIELDDVDLYGCSDWSYTGDYCVNSWTKLSGVKQTSGDDIVITKSGVTGYEAFAFAEEFSDSDAPSVTLTSPTDASTYNSKQVTLQFSVSDNRDTAPECKYYINNVETDAGEISSGSFSTTLLLEDGSSYNAYVKCTDDSNNEGTSNLVFFDINTTFICDIGELEIVDVDLSTNYDSLTPGDILDIEAQVENTWDRDMDVRLFAELFDTTDGIVIGDDNKTEKIEINEDDEETLELSLEVPIDINEDHEYTVRLKAYKSGDENEHCDGRTIWVDIEREEYDILIDEIEMDPSEPYCGQYFDLKVQVINTGDKRAEDIVVDVYSTELGIGDATDEFNLGSGSTKTAKFEDFRIPDDVEGGEYSFSIKAEFNETFDSEIFYFDVDECITGTAISTEQEFNNIDFTADRGKQLTLSKSDIPITKVTIIPLASYNDVDIKISSLFGRPSNIPLPSGEIYRYIKTFSDIPDSKIKNVKFEFRIKKSWAILKNIDKNSVILKRYYSGAWSSLSTTLEREDTSYYYYSAESPGMSVFAISAATTGVACGNNIKESGEDCDGTDDAACPGKCRSDCTCSLITGVGVCGNNIKESGEECDGLDDFNCPGKCLDDKCICSTAPSVCGNNIQESGEECDGTDSRLCPGACTPSCNCLYVCGDGVCESGAGETTSNCPSDCKGLGFSFWLITVLVMLAGLGAGGYYVYDKFFRGMGKMEEMSLTGMPGAVSKRMPGRTVKEEGLDTQQMSNYIESTRRQGYTGAQIKEALLKAGWDPKIVDLELRKRRLL